jgi:hypothetical protein
MPPPAYRLVSYDLNGCLAIARILDDLGGVGNADQVAHHLGYSGTKNGAFLTKMANARHFGLIEGSSSKLRPSPLALQILRPEYPMTEARARLTAFETVGLFRDFLDHFHGQVLPDTTGMRNALETLWAIQKDRSAMVLARLLDSAEQAGLFATAGTRTKMIRPTFVDAQSGSPPSPNGNDTPFKDSVPQPPAHIESIDARQNKLIDGALDLLPPTNATWDELELQQWLAFLTSALRVVYKLPEA